MRELTEDNGNFGKVMDMVNKTTPSEPFIEDKIHLENEGKKYLCEVKIMTLWDGDSILKRKSVVVRIIPNNSFESLDVVDAKNYNDEEFEQFYSQMKKVFDTVRVVDPIKTETVSGAFLKTVVDDSVRNDTLKCYSIWDKNERCQNCISYKAMKTKRTQAKLEFLNDSVYQIFSKYMEVNGQPRVVEMVYQNRGDLLLDAYGKNEFLSYITSYNRRLYRDPLTNAYNRRYYEEVGKHIKDVTAVGMVDVDNFKMINDSFGHMSGDKAICAVAETIRQNISGKDKLVRYGGDEFVLLFIGMTKEEFEPALAKIVKAVEETRIDSIPQAKLSITVGGVADVNDMENAIAEADRLMYKGKSENEHIVTKENGEKQ